MVNFAILQPEAYPNLMLTTLGVRYFATKCCKPRGLSLHEIDSLVATSHSLHLRIAALSPDEGAEWLVGTENQSQGG